MSVWLLIHDDRDYDMGSTEIRGAYSTKDVAVAAIVTRTASGRPSRAYLAHSADCCSVEEFELLDQPVLDTREDDPPPTGKPLFSPAVAGALRRSLETPSFLKRLLVDGEKVGTITEIVEDDRGLTFTAKLDK